MKGKGQDLELHRVTFFDQLSHPKMVWSSILVTHGDPGESRLCLKKTEMSSWKSQPGCHLCLSLLVSLRKFSPYREVPESDVSECLEDIGWNSRAGDTKASAAHSGDRLACHGPDRHWPRAPISTATCSKLPVPLAPPLLRAPAPLDSALDAEGLYNTNLSASSCARCTVRPNTLQHQSVEQGKVYCRASRACRQVAHVLKPGAPWRVSAKQF